MNETNGRNGEKGGIRSLSELPRDIPPPRDLWPSISAQLENTAGGESPQVETRRARTRPTMLQWAALAAVVSALAVGMWVGRTMLPGSEGQSSLPMASNGAAPTTGPNSPSGTAGSTSAGTAATGTSPAGAAPAGAATANQGAQVFASTYVIDPRYTMHREAMVRDLETKLNVLPTESRQKVAASLTNIRDSMKNIEAELGRDPANALLQEMLVNTFQDEMRVLTAVNEASDAGQDL
jgi:hypothetical protein